MGYSYSKGWRDDMHLPDTLTPTTHHKWRIAIFIVCLVFALGIRFVPTASADTNNPYAIKSYDTERQTALFILAPNRATPEATEHSRWAFDAFQQIVGSYWNIDPTPIEVTEYTAGMADEFDVIILADEFGEELPWPLVRDLANASGKEVVYFGLGGNRLLELVSFVEAPVYPEPRVLESVRYKGVTLNGGSYEQELIYEFDGTPPEGISLDAPITTGSGDPAAIQVRTELFRDERTDYLFLPFAVPRYYHTQSYTNAMLDVLHNTFGNITNHPRHALLRLEDISPYEYARPDNGFFQAYRFLKSEDIPFHTAFIARYVNPEKGLDSTTGNHRHFNYLVHKMTGEGNAVLVQHGYTHQYKNGISALDFEFWDQAQDDFAENDSPQYARERVEAAQAAMRADNLPVPDIWETPHYAAGDQTNQLLSQLYPLRYEHIPRIGSLPFPAQIDGTIFIPENLSYIHGDWSEELPAFQQRLKRLQTFRGAVPSFFWHPWRDSHELRTLVDIIQSQGYDFVHAYDVLHETSSVSGAAATRQFQTGYSDDEAYLAINASVFALYGVLLFGTARYTYDRYRFRKYLELTKRANRSLAETKSRYVKQGKPLPTFAIFVPARNEGLVIANTIENLVNLDYPKDKYQIVIIPDERELSDDVDVLTKTEVMRKAELVNTRYGFPLVSCIEVPIYYSGIYRDMVPTYEKSTKGRALNYALQTYEPPEAWTGNVDFIGVLDADGRLNEHILKEAAWEALRLDAQVLQGPVYQVSNLSQVSIVGVMAGLELARYHLTNMVPRLIRPRKIQFLAGTNYFIKRQLLEEVDGWDQHALVEDAELALRVYTKQRAVAQALTLPEIEQTPANFKIYRKQRERWARGHFELLGTILRAPIPLAAKLTFVRKIVLSQFRFVLDLAIPLIALIFLLLGYFREVVPWMQIASIVLLVSVVFMWDVYGQTYRRVVRYSDMPRARLPQLLVSAKLFFFMPAFMVIQAIPRIDAIYNFVTRKHVAWAKTERTAEKPLTQEGGTV